jgi:hypothetical protein
MAFSDAFVRSNRSGGESDPELLAACDRLAAGGWSDLVPDAVCQAPPAVAQHRRAAGIINALLATDHLFRELAAPAEPEVVRGRIAGALVLIEYCLDELGGWVALVLERSGRHRNEPIGSSKSVARLRLLDPAAAGRVAGLAGWIATVRLTTAALMQQQVKTLEIDGEAVRLRIPRAAGGGGDHPISDIGSEWTANLADLVGAVFACGAARLSNPRERAGAEFDWD